MNCPGPLDERTMTLSQRSSAQARVLESRSANRRVAASSGLGRSVTPSATEVVRGRLNEVGCRAHRRLCNALDEKDVEATVGSIVREFGRIDILVNAVGGSTVKAMMPPFAAA